MKKDIYFNTVVSQYFNVQFNNLGDTTKLIASTILNCPIVSWDIDKKKMLEELADKEVSLLGRGSGVWEIYVDQNKPDTEKWNNPEEQDDDVQSENGKTAMKDLGEFLKNSRMMFI